LIAEKEWKHKEKRKNIF